MRRFKSLWPLSLSLVFGCGPIESPRLNAPPQGESEVEPPMMQENFVYLNDQGMMADMSLGDIHFVPHSTELSGVGIVRLERYAELLASSGGTLHYSTSIRDLDFLGQRIAVANSFLKQSIPGSRPVEVVLGMPGGRGMTAKEALADMGVAQTPEPRQTGYYLSGPSDTSTGR